MSSFCDGNCGAAQRLRGDLEGCEDMLNVASVRATRAETEVEMVRQRIDELEGALDDAMAEIRRLIAWRERAWRAMREAGVEAREIMRRLDLEPESGC